MATKICPKCGTGFQCEGEKDCWCESVQIHKKDMLEITSRYTDCLCPACLYEFSER